MCSLIEHTAGRYGYFTVAKESRTNTTVIKGSMDLWSETACEPV